MSITAKEGWLKDKDGNYLSPNTLIDQVYYADGSKAKEKLESAVQSADIADTVTEAIAGGASVVPSGNVVKELNKSLVVDDLLWSGYINTSGAIEYTLNKPYDQYQLLIINMGFYGNVYSTNVFPASWFGSTSSGTRLYNASIQGTTVDVYKGSTTSKIYIGVGAASKNIGVRVYGIKFA